MGMHYRLGRMIGEGAFAKVYLAENGEGRRYACKTGGELKMLRREAEVLGGVYHPLFPAYAGYEESGGTGRLFMEYIPGRSLGQLARSRGGICAVQALRIARELADGLGYLHGREPSVLYRDLKPDNIMVCQDGHIKLIDFGCACFQDGQDGARVGTPGFAPPEQLAPDAAAGMYSDVYALGRTIQSVMTEGGGKRGSSARRYLAVRCPPSKRLFAGDGVKMGIGTGHGKEGICRKRLEQMIGESTREDYRQRPQDMGTVGDILSGKRKKETGVICEKNIWESSYKNTCSLPFI